MTVQNKKVALINLGCPKNDVDSEILAGHLKEQGARIVPNHEEAEMIFINTCGFIQEAKEESIQTILQTLQLKGQNGNPKVYVWGCLVQRYRSEIEKEIPEVDGFFGLEPFEEMGRSLFGRTILMKDGWRNRQLSTPSHVAYVKIADGCSHKCTFCAIPLIKGKTKSRPVKSIAQEVKMLAERGVKEIILVAQDTTAYGRDLENRDNLHHLLQKLLTIPGLQWIRLLYAHPLHLTDDVISLMASEERICNYLDIPLQHISDPILQAMGRGTSRRMIEDLIDRLRKRIPNLVLRTAFIAGFPGETDNDFQELLDFVQKMRFERLGAFVYSHEEGTEAFSSKNLVPVEIAQERYNRLMEVQNGISEEINETFVSKKIPVMIDGFDENQNCFYGRTQGDSLEIDQQVWVRGNAPIGEIVPVQIEESSTYDLYGRI